MFVTFLRKFADCESAAAWHSDRPGSIGRGRAGANRTDLANAAVDYTNRADRYTNADAYTFLSDLKSRLKPRAAHYGRSQSAVHSNRSYNVLFKSKSGTEAQAQN